MTYEQPELEVYDVGFYSEIVTSSIGNGGSEDNDEDELTGNWMRI